ncbi:MazG nucleotide pyrophosphohydrolase domain-containing protein [Halorubrum trueperi]|uniref:MazG nucleotide pyrophosphohydrolase domain-containing protein n=1 Tax=Halorubrum trueperi TaxID=2004704 RepID=A0ABD5UNN5_9EURY
MDEIDMDEQQRVATFVDEHGLETPPEYRLLDLVSEVGEVAKDAAESTEYGAHPGRIDVDDDEIGDVLFALLAIADSLDVDAGDALDRSLAKYERRMADADTPGSGE